MNNETNPLREELTLWLLKRIEGYREYLYNHPEEAAIYNALISELKTILITQVQAALQSQSLPEPAKSLQECSVIEQTKKEFTLAGVNLAVTEDTEALNKASGKLGSTINSTWLAGRQAGFYAGMEHASKFTDALIQEITSLRYRLSQQSLQPEGKGLEGWIEIDIESENYPADFEPVYVFTADNKLKIGMLMKYGSDLENAEWQIDGLPYNVAFDYVTHYQDLPSPPQSK